MGVRDHFLSRQNLGYTSNKAQHADISIDLKKMINIYNDSTNLHRDRIVFEWLDSLSESELQTARFLVRKDLSLQNSLLSDIFEFYKRD